VTSFSLKEGGRRGSREVRGLGRHVGEKWYARVRGGTDEGLGLVRYHVRFVVGGGRLVVLDGAVVVDLVIVIVDAVDVREPPVPSWCLIYLRIALPLRKEA
jgi:hypothetical protein